jgi:release factor glutamine methyltransferase
LSGATVVATDTSAEALALARENIELLGFDIELREGDLLAGAAGPFELVVSNPPYVDAAELDVLEPEVRDWEPRAALLDEGQTARLIDVARDVLDGALVLEVHEARADELAERLRARGYDDVAVSPDLTGRPRVVEGRWSNAR